MLVICFLVTYSLSDLNQQPEQSEIPQCFAGFNQWLWMVKLESKNAAFKFIQHMPPENLSALKSFINEAIQQL